MATLFPAEGSDLPNILGLTYLSEYLNKDEERTLTTAIDREEWDTSWDRRRQPYGASYGRQAGSRRPIPPWGAGLAERLLHDGVVEQRCDQMLVNEYLPGQGIAMHCDYEPFDRTVVSISLLAPCVMDLRRRTDGRRESVLLEPRGVLILSDEARYEWEHGIARRKNDQWHGVRFPRKRRLSITFRRLTSRYATPQ
jgi:alkylated DNA repair dioxygenase AlkB